MVDLLAGLVKVVYFCAAGGLLLYALNCYVLIFLFRRRPRKCLQRPSRFQADAAKEVIEPRIVA